MADTNPLYLVQGVPGKGHGLVAASKISKGTRILSEAPLIQVPRDVNDKDQLRRSIAAKLASLSEDQRRSYFALKNSHAEEGSELGIAKTNALPLGSGAPKGAVFLVASRINHCCHQNAQNTWNEKLQKLTIHACQDIEEGEEITITYLSEHAGYVARQRTLQARFRFRCSCHVCSLPISDRKLSDGRLHEIQKLDDAIGDGMALLSTPLDTLHNVQRLLELLKVEGLGDASVPRAYYDAFQVTVTHGDLARAKVFAERAMSSRKVLEGDDSPDVERLQRLYHNPSQHRSYGISNKWKSSIGDFPKELAADELELWLWRQQKPCDLQFADLRCEPTFPAFENLPGEHDVNFEFYESTVGVTLHPNKHWAFLGEIVDVEAMFRLRLIVKDRNEQEIPVAFYTNQAGYELAPSMRVVGYTVVILYAEQHGFLDLTFGIRLERPELLRVSPE